MALEDKIDRILELQGKMSTDIAVLKQSHDNHLEDFKEVKKSHYALKTEFTGLKGKVAIIAAVIGGIFTFIGNAIYKAFSGHN